MEGISGFEVIMVVVFALVVWLVFLVALSALVKGGVARGAGSWPPLPTPGKAGKKQDVGKR
jgi:hypothetical protein